MIHFLSSMNVDRCIADADILVDMAHVLMLSKRNIIERETAQVLLKALLGLYDQGIPDSVFDDRFEDIHAGIESYLVSTTGEEAGGRLHIGRSRNDEVAACIRMRVREDITRQLAILVSLRNVLLDRAEENISTVMPGFTHLQHAQPTTLAHHLLSYEAAFARDFERLSESFSRVNKSPSRCCGICIDGVSDRSRSHRIATRVRRHPREHDGRRCLTRLCPRSTIRPLHSHDTREPTLRRTGPLVFSVRTVRGSRRCLLLDEFDHATEEEPG